MDDPFGPPQVTCSAWIIYDRKGDKAIGGKKFDSPMHIASTTKIMTAYLVFKLAAERPEIMTKWLLFRSEPTIRLAQQQEFALAERVSVKELLYGLLLPIRQRCLRSLGGALWKKIFWRCRAARRPAVLRLLYRGNESDCSRAKDDADQVHEPTWPYPCGTSFDHRRFRSIGQSSLGSTSISRLRWSAGREAAK